MDLELADVAVLQVIQHATETDSSSSDDDDEDENDLLRIFIGVAREQNEVPIRIANYIENVVYRSSPETFQSHFRLSWDAYIALENEIGPIINRDNNNERLPIPIRNKILPVLWLLSTPESYRFLEINICYRSIGDRFNMAKSSLFYHFHSVIQALHEVAPRIITWPNQERRQIMRQRFEEAGGLPNIVGAIDGTFIKIKAPHEDKEVYVTRKCCYAYTLQGICDLDLKFIDVFTGYPGSVSDIRIFENSHIYNDIIRNQDQYFDQGEYIIGDKAYPVFEWCITPFIDRGNLTEHQRNFNRAVSRVRATIERSWALLFGRFRRLRFLDMNQNDLIPGTIIACCVLHNICLDNDPEQLEEYVADGNNYRLENYDPVQEYDIELITIAGKAYRNRLCTNSKNLN